MYKFWCGVILRDFMSETSTYIFISNQQPFNYICVTIIKKLNTIYYIIFIKKMLKKHLNETNKIEIQNESKPIVATFVSKAVT